MLRFERQPPGTALTRSTLVAGTLAVVAAGWFVVAREPEVAAVFAAAASVLLLVEGTARTTAPGDPPTACSMNCSTVRGTA